MVLNVPFSSTLHSIPTPDELDARFASLETTESDGIFLQPDRNITTVIKCALADAHNFASQLCLELRSKRDRFHTHLTSIQASNMRNLGRPDTQSLLTRDLEILRLLQASILEDPSAGWKSVNKDAKQKGYILCFAPAVDKEDGKGVVVVMSMPLGYARCPEGKLTDVDRCPSRRIRLRGAKLWQIY